MTQLNRGLRRKRLSGFTLLEVLVAIAILGLGLTIVLSAQTGAFWSYSRARHLSRAPSLLRCKMAEIEEELLREGFPLLEEHDDGECCEDEAVEGYSCAWKIQRVRLPEMPVGGAFAEGDAGAGEEESGLGAFGALASLQQTGGGAQSGDAHEIGDLSDMMGGGAAAAGVAPMVMSLVYPDLKPMLEASIRKVTVTVTWQEGLSERDLAATLYITNPQQGGFDPLAAEGLAEGADQLLEEAAGGLGLPLGGTDTEDNK